MAVSNLKNSHKKEAVQYPETKNEEDDSENASSDNESNEDSDGAEGNAGWANSLAKVLNTTKPQAKKNLVLSRAKKILPNDKNSKKKTDYGFEVEGEEIPIKEEKPDKDALDDILKTKKNIHLDLRVKPSWKDLERERALRKIAQRGVVQLFNAVRIQQKDLQHQLEEAGPLDSRKDAVLNNINKRKFLDVLMGGKRAKSEAIDNQVKDESSDDDEEAENGESKKKKSEWSVLKDDFMTNKKTKHWDEDDSDNPQDDNDDDSDEDEED